MKLIEIREAIEKMLKEVDRLPFDEQGDYVFTHWPRMPYSELPNALREKAREKVSVSELDAFLALVMGREEYDRLKSEYLDGMTEPPQKRKREKPQDYEKRLADYEAHLEERRQQIWSRLITRARNTATYTIEGRNWGGNPGISKEDLSVELYGTDAQEAFMAVLPADTRPPQLNSVIPQKHVIANHAIVNSLSDVLDAGKRKALPVALKGKEGEVNTYCMATYEGDNVTISSRQTFDEYDRNVSDAVTSLYLYGDPSHIITPAMVYRTMIHATDTETPSAHQIEAVTRSLDKLRFVRVVIDCSEELTYRNLSLNGAQVTNGKIDTYLQAMEMLEVTAGDQTVKAYRVLKTPILYEYSHMIGQVLTVPANLLDIREKRKDGAVTRAANTEQRIAIKGYLLRRIEVMKGKTKQHRSILYKTLLAGICEEDASGKRRHEIRQYVKTCLDYWKEVGYIAGYAEYKEGREIAGVKIRF